ncbi:MAG: hypothetical protein ACLUHE_12870 [Christensenellales bacterium]
MDEWMDEAFGRAWINYANISLLDMGLITEQEYQKMAVKITNSPDRLLQWISRSRDRIGIGLVTGKAAWHRTRSVSS